MIEIPLNSNPKQIFSITISGVTYDIEVKINSRTEVWSLSIGRFGTSILTDVALLGGVNIFNQFNIPIKNAFVINMVEQNEDANDSNLGTAVRLFILTDEELQSASSV